MLKHTKAFLLMVCLVPAAVGAQQLVMLDRGLKAPFTFADSMTLQHLADGAFPVYVADLPAIIQHLQGFAATLQKSKNPAPAPDTLRSTHCLLFMSKEDQKYRCVLQVSNEAFSVPMVIGNAGRKTTLQRLNQFTEYLRQNKALVQKTAPAVARH